MHPGTTETLLFISAGDLNTVCHLCLLFHPIHIRRFVDTLPDRFHPHLVSVLAHYRTKGRVLVLLSDKQCVDVGPENREKVYQPPTGSISWTKKQPYRPKVGFFVFCLNKRSWPVAQERVSG